MANYVDLVDDDEEPRIVTLNHKALISPKATSKSDTVADDQLISIYTKPSTECARSDNSIHKTQKRTKRKLQVVRRPRKKHKHNTRSSAENLKPRERHLKGNSSEMPITLDDDSDAVDMTANVGDCLGAPPVEVTKAGNSQNSTANASDDCGAAADADDLQHVSADADDVPVTAHAGDCPDEITDVDDCRVVSAEAGEGQDVPAKMGACNDPKTNAIRKCAEELYAKLTQLCENNYIDCVEMSAIFDAMAPDVIGDDLMIALLGETPAKQLCQRRLVTSKNPLISRGSSQLLKQWKKWVLHYRADDEDTSGAANNQDPGEIVEHSKFLSKSACASLTPVPTEAISQSSPPCTPTVPSKDGNTQPNTAECVDLAMDHDSDNDNNDSSILSPSRSAQTPSGLQTTEHSQHRNVNSSTEKPTR